MANETATLSPRRLTHALSLHAEGSAPPRQPDSLAAHLWNASQDLAQAALESDYIQGIKQGTLNPNNFGQYSVQDVAYCHNGLEDWKAVATRAQQPDIKAFAEARVKSWAKYAQETYGAWHISDPAAVQLSVAAQTYSAFESEVAHHYDPLYTVVVMIPCDRLWYWLANQIKSGSSATNVYDFWINGNSASDNGAHQMENVVDTHAAQLDEDTALHVYRTAMLGEVNFFRSTCRQPLLEMPGTS